MNKLSVMPQTALAILIVGLWAVLLATSVQATHWIAWNDRPLTNYELATTGRVTACGPDYDWAYWEWWDAAWDTNGWRRAGVAIDDTWQYGCVAWWGDELAPSGLNIELGNDGSTWWVAYVRFGDLEYMPERAAWGFRRWTIHINMDRYRNLDPWSKQLVWEHETGHGLSLADHAEGRCDLIMGYCWARNTPAQIEADKVSGWYWGGYYAPVEEATEATIPVAVVRDRLLDGMLLGIGTGIGGLAIAGALEWFRRRKRT